ncbi:hypothetical protein GCM10023215_35400 [Pseudonocardia yuanmonensis]|uniref:Uncharacterized protein n=1 Tax=Pseudonocardia yuanmonensis TaxID=1095914 RepID=A0ABP8WSE9_9PSEU
MGGRAKGGIHVLLVLLSIALGLPVLLMLAVLMLARLEAALLAPAPRRPAPGAARNPRTRAAARPRAHPARVVTRPAPGPTLPACRISRSAVRRP